MGTPTRQRITFGHTQVKEDWHLFSTGKELFFGRSKNAVIRKMQARRRQQAHREMSDQFQKEAPEYTANQRGNYA